MGRMDEVGLRCIRRRPGLFTAKTASAAWFIIEHTAFTFLGYTFRARGARSQRRKMFTSFLPAICKDALNKVNGGGAVLATAPPHGRSLLTFSREINPVVQVG